MGRSSWQAVRQGGGAADSGAHQLAGGEAGRGRSGRGGGGTAATATHSNLQQTGQGLGQPSPLTTQFLGRPGPSGISMQPGPRQPDSLGSPTPQHLAPPTTRNARWITLPALPHAWKPALCLTAHSTHPAYRPQRRVVDFGGHRCLPFPMLCPFPRLCPSMTWQPTQTKTQPHGNQQPDPSATHHARWILESRLVLHRMEAVMQAKPV